MTTIQNNCLSYKEALTQKASKNTKDASNVPAVVSASTTLVAKCTQTMPHQLNPRSKAILPKTMTPQSALRTTTKTSILPTSLSSTATASSISSSPRTSQTQPPAVL
jgi:hypothetical protein